MTLSTSSSVTKFSLIPNYFKIGNVLAQLINQRQTNTASPSEHTFTASQSMDDLVKLKDLLDKGIITQEDFEAKKKELLGL